MKMSDSKLSLQEAREALEQARDARMQVLQELDSSKRALADALAVAKAASCKNDELHEQVGTF